MGASSEKHGKINVGSFLTFSRRTASTARFEKYSLSCDKTLDDSVVRAMLTRSCRNVEASDLIETAGN